MGKGTHSLQPLPGAALHRPASGNHTSAQNTLRGDLLATRIKFSLQLKNCFKHRNGSFSGFAFLTGFLLTVPLQCSCKRFGSMAACCTEQHPLGKPHHQLQQQCQVTSLQCPPTKNPSRPLTDWFWVSTLWAAPLSTGKSCWISVVV